MYFRHEVKHEINYADLLAIRHRQNAVMYPDPHTIDGKSSSSLPLSTIILLGISFLVLFGGLIFAGVFKRRSLEIELTTK